jgi:heterodisulfide reductase subunit C
METREIIDTGAVDPDFKFLVASDEDGAGILKCFACGSCTARCPEQKVKPEYNPRLIIRKTLIGLKDEVFRSEFLWICSSHFLCLSKCPQDVNIKGVMDAVRNRRIFEETLRTRHEDMRSQDNNFKYEIAGQECGQDLFHCFACGSCTAGCPERSLDAAYSPRVVIRKILVGLKDEVFENPFVEICSAHARCLNECPQGVEIPRLMTALRRLAEKAGYTREGRLVEKEAAHEKIEREKRRKGETERVFIK